MSEYTLEPWLAPVGDVIMTTKEHKRTFIYKPKEDITNVELARLLHLFVVATTMRGNFGLSWEPFVEEHKLWRHFEEKINDRN